MEPCTATRKPMIPPTALSSCRLHSRWRPQIRPWLSACSSCARPTTPSSISSKMSSAGSATWLIFICWRVKPADMWSTPTRRVQRRLCRRCTARRSVATGWRWCWRTRRIPRASQIQGNDPRLWSRISSYLLSRDSIWYRTK